MRIAKAIVAAGLGLAISVGAIGCKSSSNPNVTSDIRSQWIDVNADTKTTTAAAKDVLTGDELNKVKASSTEVDGEVTGTKADGTKVTVMVKKTGEAKSQVTVTVGMTGDSTLGADLASRIKTKAEGH